MVHGSQVALQEFPSVYIALCRGCFSGFGKQLKLKTYNTLRLLALGILT